MRSYLPSLAFVGLLAATFPVEAATVGVPVDFESGTTEGWTGGASPANQPSGGALGEGDNFLMLKAAGGGGGGSKLATFHVGLAWVGDYAADGVGAFVADLMNPNSSAPLEMRLVLFGPDSINNRWTSVDATTVPNDGIWRTYRFPIAENTLTSVQGTSTYSALLSNVVRLMLRHDAGTPSADGTSVSAQLGIDNVFLAEGLTLDCNGDGQVGAGDLDCIVSVGGASRLHELLATTGHVAGDLDGDGSVAFADFLVLSANFGRDVSSYTDGDIDADGRVGFSDFLILSNHFGDRSEAVRSVPEPISWGTLATALGFLGVFCRRRLTSRTSPSSRCEKLRCRVSCTACRF